MYQTSIIIPMWNEEAWVQQAYQQLKKFIEDNKLDAQLVFATDGCTDRTVEIIQELQKKDPSLINFNHTDKLGRGKALRYCFHNLDTPYLIYMDSDLATDINHIPQLIQYLDGGSDVVTGSRLMEESSVKRSKKRDLFSRVYNLSCRLAFGSKLHDHQCGFKAFRRDSLIKFIDEVENNGWFWDTELLLRAQRMKLKVKEFPVVWTDRDETASKVNVWKDAKNMGWNLIQLRWKLLPLSLQQFVKFCIVGAVNTLITLLVLFILDSTIGRGQFGYPFAYGVGAINSYIWNKFITFQQKQVTKRTPIQFILFFILALGGMFVYSYTALFFEEIVGFHYAIASIAGTIVNFLIQFLISKFVVFRKYLE